MKRIHVVLALAVGAFVVYNIGVIIYVTQVYEPKFDSGFLGRVMRLGEYKKYAPWLFLLINLLPEQDRDKVWRLLLTK